MPIKNSKLGVVSGEPYIFSEADICLIADALDMEVEEFVKEYNGIPCNLNVSDEEVIGVDTLHWVDKDNKTYPVTVIGGNPDDFQRFLEE